MQRDTRHGLGQVLRGRPHPGKDSQVRTGFSFVANVDKVLVLYLLWPENVRALFLPPRKPLVTGTNRQPVLDRRSGTRGVQSPESRTGAGRAPCGLRPAAPVPAEAGPRQRQGGDTEPRAPRPARAPRKVVEGNPPLRPPPGIGERLPRRLPLRAAGGARLRLGRDLRASKEKHKGRGRASQADSC